MESFQYLACLDKIAIFIGNLRKLRHSKILYCDVKEHFKLRTY